jgi:hypothetical protein
MVGARVRPGRVMIAEHTAGTRYRIVTRTTRAGRCVEEHVSAVVLAREEVHPSLVVEAKLMESAGWEVERIATAAGLRRVLGRKGDRARTIEARPFSPMDDAA